MIYRKWDPFPAFREMTSHARLYPRVVNAYALSATIPYNYRAQRHLD